MTFVQSVFARAGHWLANWFDSVGKLEESAQSDYQAVEFIGGPLDGHTAQATTESIFQITSVVEVPVCRARFELIDGIEPTHFDRPTSIALYDLVPKGPEWQFRFSHQMPASR